METEETSRSGRVRKKSSKLLSIEQDSIKEQQLALESVQKVIKAKNKPKPSTSDDQNATKSPSKPKKSATKPAKVVPKLRIKLGSVPTLSVSKSPKASKRPLEDPSSASPKVKKQRKSKEPGSKATPKLKEPKQKKTTPSKKRKSKETHSTTPVVAGTLAIEEAVAVEETVPDSDQNEDALDNSGENSSNKRQRKPPAKLKEDYVNLDASNKAAKFFRTKKAESKAAVAIARQKKGKDGRKGKRNRTPTAYTMWCNSYRAKLQVQCPGMDFASMNKKLGEVWWSIPLKEKNLWKRRAKRLATHGLPNPPSKNMNYVGSKALQALLKKHPDTPNTVAVTSQQAVSSHSTLRHNAPVTTAVPRDPPMVYKVTQTEPVDVAAHFDLLSDAMNSIGRNLRLNTSVDMEESLSQLLDGFLCSVSSLMCLTQQVPQLDGDISAESHRKRMSDVAYFIPDV